MSAGETWHQNLLSIVEAASAMGTPVEWKFVVKQVLRSQPPRAKDVPDMAEFVRKWGGMPTGAFIKELTPLLNHFMPSDRIVGGNFFKALCDIKFPYDSMPAHVINAVLFRHAAANDGVCDGFARYITKPDLAILAKPEKRADVILANGAIKRAKEYLAEQTDVDPSMAEALKGQLLIDVVDFLLDKNKSKPKQGATQADSQGETITLQSLLEKFIAKLSVDSPPGAASTGPHHAQAAGSSNPAPNFITYNAVGEVEGVGKTTASNKDIVEGSYLQLKKQETDVPPAMQDMWQITEVLGDGTVKAAKVMPDGKTHDAITSLPLAEVDNFYKICKPRVFAKGYPSTDATHDRDLIVSEYKGMVFGAINALLRKFGSTNARVIVKPFKAVVASEKFKAGAYVAVPASRFIVSDTDAQKNQTKYVDVTINGGADDLKMCIAPSPPTDEFVVQYWCLRTEHDRDKCNCEIKAKQIKTKSPVFSDKNFNPGHIELTIPCAVNFKAIDVDQEIVLYIPKAEQDNTAIKKTPRCPEPLLEAKRSRKA